MGRFLFYLVVFVGAGGVTWLASHFLGDWWRETILAQANWARRQGAHRALSISAALVTAGSVVAVGGFMGRPFFGLLVVFLFPVALERAGTAWEKHQARARDRSAITYLYALHGLIQVGMSLPTALFELSKRVPAPFAKTLSLFLDRFDDGKPLHACLSRFRARSDLRLSGTCLALLELAYRRGLSVAPLLERILPVLEAERESTERIDSLRYSLLAQAAVAFMVPWFLAGAMAFFQPEVLVRFTESGWFGWLLAGAVAFEAIGIGVLWRLSAFD